MKSPLWQAGGRLRHAGDKTADACVDASREEKRANEGKEDERRVGGDDGRLHPALFG